MLEGVDKVKRTMTTKVTSRTWDMQLKRMYPDRLPVVRHVEEILRLLEEHHKVQWRVGYRSMDLTIEKFWRLAKSLFPDWILEREQAKLAEEEKERKEREEEEKAYKAR